MDKELEESLMTFEEWTDSGYVIIKGEKSSNRDKLGNALFHKDQVKKGVYKPKLLPMTKLDYLAVQLWGEQEKLKIINLTEDELNVNLQVQKFTVKSMIKSLQQEIERLK